MDENPYNAPHEHTAPPDRWLPVLWSIAVTVAVILVMGGMLFLAVFVHHVVLFSVAVVVLVCCTAVGVRARLQGRRTFGWPIPRWKGTPPTAEQIARLRFWLPFLMGSVPGIIVWFYFAPFIQALFEVLARVQIPAVWIGIAGSILQVAICYAVAWQVDSRRQAIGVVI